MIFAADVCYEPQVSRAAGVLFRTWEDEKPHRAWILDLPPAQAYQSGAFYLRELPCLQALLAQVSEDLEALVVDGFVHLGPDRRPGLGQHLYEGLNRRIPVVGVAKTPFHGTPAECGLIRGQAQRPLWITAAGISIPEARDRILRMAGDFRLPTQLKLADQLCRGKISPDSFEISE